MRLLCAMTVVSGVGVLAASHRDEGVPDESPVSHWAFVRPERVEPPPVSSESWVRNPLDRFVLARLEAEGLTPSPEADRATLIRRVSLDLTGLPPTTEEVEAFEADAGEDAYERLVDRLLASPRYGERMAVPWLDLARYADTNGYLDDGEREMWKWRDWVIAAFNANMPFDRFTTEQLAGDMLPDATVQQRVASGFNRNHPVANEGDGQPGEYAHHYVADRVRTTAVAWMGLTMGCAECHDHKYDPISQREYYRFYAYFDNVPEQGLVNEDNAPPFLRLPSEEQGARLAELQGALDRLASKREQLEVQAAAAQSDWEAQLADSAVATPLEGLVAHISLDAEVPGVADLRGIGHSEWVDGVRGRALQLDGRDSFVEAGDVGAFGADDAFSVSAWVRFEGEDIDGGGTIVAKMDENQSFRGYTLDIGAEYPQFQLRSSFVEEDEIEAEGRDRIQRGRWYHLTGTYDGSRKSEGMRLYVNGEPAPLYEPPEEEEEGGEAEDDEAAAAPAVAEGDEPAEEEPEPGVLRGEIDHDVGLRIGCTDGDPFAGTIDEVLLFERALAPEEVHALVRADLAQLASKDELTAGQRLLLRDYYQMHVSPELAPVHAELAETRAERVELLQDVPLVSVMAELDERRPTRLLKRGDYSTPGPVVEPGVPEVLPPLVERAPADRLDLARWLMHPDHPLVGRVTVNRLWAQFFGRGLVATLDDFGLRGERPSHPELLDWLAREFVDGGWDTKALVRTVVTSATYRQDSRIDADLLARDPDNRLLARAPRRVLEAEFVRDNALAIGGVLDERLYGPAVRPWQPDGVWLAGAGIPGEDYRPSPVEDRYRRGLYVYWKREVPYASFTVFDAPTRETCTLARTRTNTPLQALALLNDRVYVEAARGLAQRILGEAGSDEERLERAFRLCVARRPQDAELALLTRLLEEQRVRFEERPDAAKELASVGDLPRAKTGDNENDAELAAWIAVSSVLLNLDETITRG